MAKAEPLTFSEACMVALLTLREALQDNARLYHDTELFLMKLQRSKQGPLTACLAALVQGE